MAKNSYEQDLTESKNALIIKEVEEGSVGEELELSPEDIIRQINGEDVYDELDYIYMTATDEFSLNVEKPDGEIWEVQVELSPDETMGLSFYDSLSAKTCSNHCLFCFIDQMPPGMRESLYVKDDDERLSFLNGNYITLTNLTEREFDRIRRWKIPVNISVHTTDPLLRRRMLANSRAGEIMERMKELKDSGVAMNAQIVLVPDYNDTSLVKSLEDLSTLFPELSTVSVVPVGLTRYREGLAPLRLFRPDEAERVLEEIEDFQTHMRERTGSSFVFASDEFYLLAGREIPESEFYEGFRQLENGVGMLALFKDEFNAAVHKEEEPDGKKRIAVTGILARDFLDSLIHESGLKNKGLSLEIHGVKNEFFGKNITVAGLLTGRDIIDSLKKTDLSRVEEILIPDTVLKNGTDLLLDDLSTEDLARELKTAVQIVGSDGGSFYRAVMGERNG